MAPREPHLALAVAPNALGGPQLPVGTCSCSWRAESTGTSSHLSSRGSGLGKWGQAWLAGLCVHPGAMGSLGMGCVEKPLFLGKSDSGSCWELLERGLFPAALHGMKARREKVDPIVAQGVGIRRISGSSQCPGERVL